MSAIVAIVLANRRKRNKQKLLRTASVDRRRRAETRPEEPLDTAEQVRLGASRAGAGGYWKLLRTHAQTPVQVLGYG